MPFTEHSIGKGTIAYRGEHPDYWWRKSALWRPRRTAITIVVAVSGLLLLAYAAGPLAQHHASAQVLSRVVDAPRAGSEALPTTRLDLSVEGRPVTVVTDDPVVAADDAYGPGQVVPVTTGGIGVTRLGADDLLWPWVFGGLLVLVGAGRALWDRRTADRLHYFR